MSSTATVSVPSTPEEAIAITAGSPGGVTIIGGGTIVVPQHSLGRLAVDNAVWIGRAGLDSVSSDGGIQVIGAAASLAACAALGPPLGACAANIGDRELQAQATIGGNICAPQPAGDLRGPLLALDASLRTAGADGETTTPMADFDVSGNDRLVLDVRYDLPSAGAFVAMRRHHTHSLTPMAISAVRGTDGTVRLAATGAAPRAVRLTAAETTLAAGGSNEEAGQAALDDAEPYDDVLASASYRRRVLPVLVRRALDQLGG